MSIYKKISFIGCGKTGKTIAKLISSKKLGEIEGIYNSTYSSSEATVKYLKQGKSCRHLYELPQSDIYFITTPDDMIENVCMMLTEQVVLKPGTIIVHCSGLLPSLVLTSARRKGCYIASMHPIKSMANPDISSSNFDNTYCGYEGDIQAKLVLKKLFENMGAIVFDVDRNSKSLYHAGLVIASNYMITLIYSATKCLENAGIKPSTAKKINIKLIQDALVNLETMPWERALTGPLQRGDLSTISNHLMSLKASPDIKEMYMAFAKSTLDLVPQSNKAALLDFCNKNIE